MKLYSLIKNLNCRVLGNTVLEISGLYHQDTEVKEGGLFFCLRGTKVDGTNFVKSAIANGAVAVVSETELSLSLGVTQIIVKNAREFMSILSCRFFGNPADKLKIIGVTGTNGKTTITNLIANSLEFLGQRCAIIGTSGVIINGKIYDSGMTTPDPIELQKYFSKIVKSKIEYVCMEVSAHAIDLSKIAGFRFSQVIFTNLTEDHLDYFKTMEKYYLAKAKLFTKKYTDFAIINTDDEYGKRLYDSINLTKLSYAINNSSDLTAKNINSSNNGQSFVAGENEYNISLLGRFNIYNSLAAILSLKSLGFSDEEVTRAIKNLQPVSGRFNTYIINDVIVVIDYAHTPDGLKNVLLSCRELAGSKKVISVFGCGGNRETQKRQIMGEISSKNADLTIITSDNPRYESREKIAKDIEKGIDGGSYQIVLERSEAIKSALMFARSGDVVLIAGKGSEPYIDENGIKIPYSDKAEIEKYRR